MGSINRRVATSKMSNWENRHASSSSWVIIVLLSSINKMNIDHFIYLWLINNKYLRNVFPLTCVLFELFTPYYTQNDTYNPASSHNECDHYDHEWSSH